MPRLTLPTKHYSSSGGSGQANPIYGGIPNLPTTQNLQSNLTGILNQAIPGYTGLTQSASSIISDAMGGKLPSDVQNLIKNNAATQAAASGMPGSNAIGGTLQGNRTLRDLGLTSLQRQDTGFRDLISLLQGVSGTAAPTFGQAQDQANTIATYKAAPDPEAAAREQERLFNQYSNPAFGTVGTGEANKKTPWYLLMNSGGAYSLDPFTGAPRPSKVYSGIV